MQPPLQLEAICKVVRESMFLSLLRMVLVSQRYENV